jgi:hypothetical protein
LCHLLVDGNGEGGGGHRRWMSSHRPPTAKGKKKAFFSPPPSLFRWQRFHCQSKNVFYKMGVTNSKKKSIVCSGSHAVQSRNVRNYLSAINKTEINTEINKIFVRKDRNK